MLEIVNQEYPFILSILHKNKIKTSLKKIRILQVLNLHSSTELTGR